MKKLCGYKLHISESIIIFYMVVLSFVLSGCNTGANSDFSKELEVNTTQNIDNTTSDVLDDGQYEVYTLLQGGSGKAHINSPCICNVNNGEITATIIWSSSNYDYMIVNGEKYFPINESGNSTFTIPVEEFDKQISVIADTVAMSTPHEIEYNITFSLNDFLSEDGNEQSESEEDASIKEWRSSHTLTSKMELKYAENFHVTYYDDKYCLLEINGTDYYLVVDENGEIPTDLPDSITVLKKPLNNIYVVSSASFNYFEHLNALDKMAYTSFKKEDAKSEKLISLMDSGNIKYAGKYSAPDYEMIISGGCDLVVENTMINHSPDVLEQFKKLSINTLVDYSSHEATPYGRMEWIKLYGLLTDNEDTAVEVFDSKEALMKDSFNDTGKTVAYFYITDAGGVVVRKNQDYIAKLIEIAGGKYIFTSDDAYKGSGTETIQKEAFFGAVSDCDILIYNTTISGDLKNKEALINKCEVLKDTKAYKNNNIYCTYDNIYLSVMELPEIAKDFNDAFNGKDVSKYLYRLE